MPPVGYKKRRHVWTRDEVIEKLREWQEAYGEPPSATDWNGSDTLAASRRSAERSRAWAERHRRFVEGEWPWNGTVAKLFGSWNNALNAAGLEIRWQGKRSRVFHEGTILDSDELRALVDEADAAMVSGQNSVLRLSLLSLADKALKWAEDVPEE